MKSKQTNLFLKFFIMMLMVTLFIGAFPFYAQAKPTKPTISVSKKTMVIGSKYQLSVKNADKKVTWSSTNPKVATVTSRGLVTAKKKGTVTIKAKLGTSVLSCRLTVVTRQKSYIKSTIKKINVKRREYGLASLDTNSYLSKAAAKRAKEIYKYSFSHTRPNQTKWTSAIDMRYDYEIAAESIACEFVNPESCVNALMRSASDKANIINRTYTDIGVGVYLGDDGYFYWCIIYAREK